MGGKRTSVIAHKKASHPQTEMGGYVLVFGRLFLDDYGDCVDG